MKKSNQTRKTLKSIAIIVALPLAMFLIMESITYLFKGTHVINSVLDIKNLIRGAGISAAIAFALSMNLTSGRMDLSLGAQRVVSTILGGLLAHQLGLSGVWMLIFVVIFGVIFGGLVGILFVTLRIPPMVLGIGMACIYECIAFAVSDGIGLRLVGIKGTSILGNANFTITVLAIIAILMYILMSCTKFSYNFRAVRGSQNIARNSGINVFTNVVICYTVAGALVAFSGLLDAAFTGAMRASMGLTSNGTVMANMFAMMIGCTFLSKYANQSVGIISAAITLRIFSMGLTAFNVSDAMNGCINMALFIGFLIYQSNSHIFKQSKYDKERIAQARELKNKKLAVEKSLSF